APPPAVALADGRPRRRGSAPLPHDARRVASRLPPLAGPRHLPRRGPAPRLRGRRMNASLRRFARLVRDERAARHRGSRLGRLWGVLLPLLETGAVTLVLGALLDLDGTGGSTVPGILVGIVAWRVFTRALLRGTTSVVRHAPLLLHAPVP